MACRPPRDRLDTKDVKFRPSCFFFKDVAVEAMESEKKNTHNEFALFSVTLKENKMV